MTDDPLLFHRVARQVAARLRGRSQGNALLVTSARPGEGKTYVAHALAAALNLQCAQSVIVVECASHAAAGERGGALSFSDLVSAAGLDPDRLLSTLRELPAFMEFGNGTAAELFRTDAVARAVDALRRRYGFVILDGPILADCGALGACADGSVLVIDSDRTRREIVKGSLQSHAVDPHKLLGAVLNQKRYYVPRWLYRRAL